MGSGTQFFKIKTLVFVSHALIEKALAEGQTFLTFLYHTMKERELCLM